MNRLPSGRHSLSRDFVRGNQQERLIAAVPKALAERSYAELAVSHVTDEAGVSRATFYQIFEGKRECVLAAHRIACDRLAARIEAAAEGCEEWDEKVAAGVSAALRFAEESHQEARLLILPSLGADSELAASVRAINEQLAEMMRRATGGRERAGDGLHLMERALVGGVTSIVAEHLISGQTEKLAELEPQLVALMLMPYGMPATA